MSSLCHKIFDDRYKIEIHLTRSAGDATEVARHFAQEKFDIVAAVGGDGTANETAQGLLGSNTAMTLIPYGSGNGLARGLMIPMNKEKALRMILRESYRMIDVGEITDGDHRKLFFGFSGIGYDAFIGKLFNERAGGAVCFPTFLFPLCPIQSSSRSRCGSRSMIGRSLPGRSF